MPDLRTLLSLTGNIGIYFISSPNLSGAALACTGDKESTASGLIETGQGEVSLSKESGCFGLTQVQKSRIVRLVSLFQIFLLFLLVLTEVAL